MHDFLLAVAATAVGVVVLVPLVVFGVLPLVRRLPWRVEERRRPGGIAIELRRPGQPPRLVREVRHGEGFWRERERALAEADALRAELNARRHERQAGSTSQV